MRQRSNKTTRCTFCIFKKVVCIQTMIIPTNLKQAFAVIIHLQNTWCKHMWILQCNVHFFNFRLILLKIIFSYLWKKLYDLKINVSIIIVFCLSPFHFRFMTSVSGDVISGDVISGDATSGRTWACDHFR
jgi:hypothetical protein